MGSSALLTVREAAALIDVVPSTIRRLTQNGTLHPRLQKKGCVLQPMYDPSELEAYAAAKSSPWDSRRRALTSVSTNAALKALERRVQQLEAMLGARLHPPTQDEDEIISIYNQAVDDLENPPTDEHTIMKWAKFFLSVGEEYFDLMEAVTDDAETIQIFNELGIELARNAPVDRFEDDLALEAAYRYLEVGRRNLRNVLFFCTRSRFGARAAQDAFGGPTDVHDEILNLIAHDT